MNQHACRNRRNVVLLALAFVLIQWYVLYASTVHVFHDTMPMCPACIAAKGYEHSMVSSTPTLFQIPVFTPGMQQLPEQIVRFVRTPTQSRAPPATTFAV